MSTLATLAILIGFTIALKAIVVLGVRCIRSVAMTRQMRHYVPSRGH